MKFQHFRSAAMISALVIFIAFIWEAFSVAPCYIEEMATIRKVVKEDTVWGYIGTDHMTIGRFDDGGYAECGGDRGEPGERALMPRLRGTTSLLGILGDRRK